MRPPGKYDALRQAEQQAQEAPEAPSQSQEAALDSSQGEPTRPTAHPAPPAKWSDWGEKLLQQETAMASAKEIAEDAAQREAAAEQSKAKDGHER